MSPGRPLFDSCCEYPRADVLGIELAAINMDAALEIAERSIASGMGSYICMTGVHGVMEAQLSAELRRVMAHALINAPDGMPMSWVGWLQGHTQMDRIYGPDFMTNLCRISMRKGYRHYLYGGQPGVAETLKAVLQRRFQGIQIVGTFTPPFRDLSPQEERALFSEVSDVKPHILWVGLSTPKQEYFMGKYVDRLGVPLLVGVGAAFDFLTGRIDEAPSWVKRAGLQWAHRLLQDPQRLSKRYLINNPVFLWRIALQLLKLRSYDWSTESTTTMR